MMWYPLRCSEVLRDYAFGGRWIPEFFPGKNLPEKGVIAETWELCALRENTGRVQNGPLEGRTLRDLISEHGPDLLGGRMIERFGQRLPILCKFLDATRELDLQVHPSDENLPPDSVEETGKTEAWHLLAVRPGAEVHCGLKHGVTLRDFYEAARERREYEVMNAYPVQPGDTIFVPAGAVHACRGGILIFEIMQNSDTTYLFEGSRNGPEFDNAPPSLRTELEAVKVEEEPGYLAQPVSLKSGANTRTIAVACRFFAIERLELTEPFHDICWGEAFVSFSCIKGKGVIECAEGLQEFSAGETYLCPAAMGEFELKPDGNSTLIKAYVPDLENDIVRPLQEYGLDAASIAGLCGEGSFNAIRPLL